MRFNQKFTIQRYNIGIIEKDIEDVMMYGIDVGDIKWLKHRYHDRFFADPFVIRVDENYIYILCEEYTFFRSKGIISLLKIRRNDFSLLEKKVVIEEQTHLSFPFCEIDQPYIIPESSSSGRLYMYEIDLESFSVLKKTCLLNEPLIDAIVYKGEINAGNVLVGSKKPNAATELYYYKKNGEMIYHQFFDDRKSARNAGAIFSVGGKQYRPVQDCESRYGKCTRIYEIISVSNNGFEEKEVQEISSKNNPPFNETLHTFNVYDGMIIIDGSKDELRFPSKVFYKKLPFLFDGRLKKDGRK